jgi:predicted MPP superfamily phosphohydrolase
VAGRTHPDQLPDPERALRGAPPGVPRIILSHRPRLAARCAAAGAQLQFSGHLHGGQFAPLTWLVRLMEPYVAGLYQVGGMQLVVSRGCGCWYPYDRYGSPPEIVAVTLARA